MAGSAARPGRDELLAQREWVRGLARSLASGGADADDLEQETMAAALRSPPPSGGYPRAWLATVLRNAFRRAGRGSARRAARERATRAPGEPEDPAEVVARAEAHGRLVEAVLGLGEPARTALLLRFYDGLPPREVARATGVPVETARSRIKRALADLRGRLGGARGREGLLALLLPLVRSEGAAAGGSGAGAGAGAAAAAAGGIAMGTAAKVAVAGAVVAAAAGGWAALRPRTSEEGPPLAAAAGPAGAPLREAPSAAGLPSAERPAPAAPTAPPPSSADEPSGPSVERRLDEELPEYAVQDITVGQAVLDLAGNLRLEPEYESPLLRQACFATSCSYRIGRISRRSLLTLLLRLVESPTPGKTVSWSVRGESLFVHLADPVPPKPDPGAETAREERERALRARLREERTSLAFDGQSLPEALQYLSARHGLDIVVAEADREKCDLLRVRLALREATIEEALDELLRLDPDLRREIRGSVVLIRSR